MFDKTKMVLFGSSQRGFLVTHLSGQFADMNWRACVCRNPVVDIAGMTEGTDIPDWCWVEAIGGVFQYALDKVVGPEVLKTMFEKSPFNYVNSVKVPTLMMVGSKDRRVPMTQGIKWYNALKVRGIPTQCLVYEDKHDLQKIEVDSDAFVNYILWILKYLK